MKTPYRNLLLSFLIICAPYLTRAQGQANIWYFGNGNGLDFNYSPPVVLENGNTNLGALNLEGVGSISDNNGALLFYTDGRNVFDKNHAEMPSTVAAGTDLLGGDGSSTQSGMILPVNGSTTQYFIFSTDNGTSKSYYSIVDMTLNSGNGDVVTASKNSPLVASGCSEAVLAIPEYNAANNPTGESWVVFHDVTTNNFRVYKTSGATVTFSASYAQGFTPSQSALLLKTNACFDKLAISFYNYGRVEVLPFNNQTGAISAPSLILAGTSGAPFLNAEVYGIEFSPNDKFLYISESGLNSRRTIYQFNIFGASGTNPAAVLASKSFFTGTTVRFGHVQLGPDGKIYVPAYNNSGTSYMSCIPTPDVQWAGATPTAAEFQYQQYTYNYVGNRKVGEGLPIFSQALLRQVKVYVTNACEGSAASFSYTFGGSAVSQTWDFGDPASGALNTSTGTAPSHIYSTAGPYTVTVNIVDNCGRTRIGTANVVIKPGPVVTVPANACPNQNITFTGTGTNAAAYIWSASPTMTPVLTTGTAYTYNGPLPYTVYVKDPTPIATYTTGNATAAATAGADVGHTYFELFTTVTLKEFQVIARLNGQAANFSIKSEDLVTNYYTVATASSVSGTTYTFNPNVTLSPGRYVLFTSNVNYSFRNNTSYNGGRDVPGVVSILGEKSGVKGGSFINIKFDLPDPCGVRAYTVVDNCPLPVGWLSFSARAEGESVGLWWNVSFEKDNSYFIVQRSEDGINFNDIGIVNGRGNANSAASYSYNDDSPSSTNYYRLKQVDINGMFSYSSIAVVQFDGDSVWAAPNPFYQELTLTFTSDESASIEVIDMTGRSVASYEKAQGNLSFVLGAGLPPGAYLIRVVSSKEVRAIPVIKK